MRSARRVRSFRCKFSGIWDPWVLWSGSFPKKTTPPAEAKKATVSTDEKTGDGPKTRHQ